eukprot:783513-Rhodomonas_salina.1
MVQQTRPSIERCRKRPVGFALRTRVPLRSSACSTIYCRRGPAALLPSRPTCRPAQSGKDDQ